MYGNFNPEAIAAFYEMAECADDEKMIFGACRKVGDKTGEKDFDSSKKSKQEEELESAAKKKGVDLKSKMNKKPIEIGGKKYGLAVKDGKVVMVAWGSVAGEAKPPAASGKKKKQIPGAGQSRGGSGTAGLNRGSQEAYIRGQQQALASQTSDAGRAAIQANINRARAGA